MSGQPSFYEGGASPTGKRMTRIDLPAAASREVPSPQGGVESQEQKSPLNQGIERILYPSMRLISLRVIKKPKGIPTAEASTILRDVKEELKQALTPEEVAELNGVPYVKTKEELKIPTDINGVARFGVIIYLDSDTQRYKLRLEPKNEAATSLDAN